MDIVHKTFLIKNESKDSSRDDLTSYLAATVAIASQSNNTLLLL